MYGIFLKPLNSLVLARIKALFCLTVPAFKGPHSATKCLGSWPIEQELLTRNEGSGERKQTIVDI